jgi:hypothetical protein
MIDIFFDNENLNDTPYHVVDFGHESVADKRLNNYELARSRGVVMVSTGRSAKRIEVRGFIQGASVGDLDSHIDGLFEILEREGKNLDISYAGGTRRYKNAYAETTRLTKRHPTMAEWSAVFVVPSGVGQATSQTSVDVENVTDDVYEGSIAIAGTAYPLPTVTIVFDSNTAGETIELLLNGNKITINKGSAFSVSDEVILDFQAQKVTLNGTEIEYQGVFPRWEIGTNEYSLTLDGTARQYDVNISYFPMYL